MSNPVAVASRAGSCFHSQSRCPLDPPPSAVMKILRALGYFFLPMCCHHLLIAVIGVTLEGRKDVLGLTMGTGGGEGAKFVDKRARRAEES